MNKTTSQQPITIVGGGPIGLLTAIALAEKSGIKSTIIDRADLSLQQLPDFDGRVISVNLGSQQFLDSLGLWTDDEGEGKSKGKNESKGDGLINFATPIKDIYVSDDNSSASVHYDHKMISEKPMGYMIEIRHLRRALLQKASSLSDFITIKDNTEIVEQNRSPFAWELTVVDKNKEEQQQIIRSGLLVAADGKFSKIRNAAEIEVVEKDYNQIALVFTVEHDLSHENYAFEHFMKDGPLAFLPIDSNKSAVVWTMSHESAAQRLKLSNEDLCKELLLSFGEVLGNFRIITKIWSYPLSIVMAKSMAKNRTVLVGDAAHGIHPVAGQGLNLGIKDIKDLLGVVSEYYPLGIDIGSDLVIGKYGRRRRFDVISISGSSHSIIRLFSNDIKPVKTLRGLGLKMVDSLPPLKKFFMRKAMGL